MENENASRTQYSDLMELLPDVLLYIEMNEGDIESDEDQMAAYEGGHHILNVVESIRDLMEMER